VGYISKELRTCRFSVYVCMAMSPRLARQLFCACDQHGATVRGPWWAEFRNRVLLHKDINPGQAVRQAKLAKHWR